MDADDRLRLDYEQATQLMRTLTDVRCKLLAFVPTIAGTKVGLVGRTEPSSVDRLARPSTRASSGRRRARSAGRRE